MRDALRRTGHKRCGTHPPDVAWYRAAPQRVGLAAGPAARLGCADLREPHARRALARLRRLGRRAARRRLSRRVAPGRESQDDRLLDLVGERLQEFGEAGQHDLHADAQQQERRHALRDLGAFAAEVARQQRGAAVDLPDHDRNQYGDGDRYDARQHELRQPDADKARSFFDRSPYGNRIILHTGNALDIIPRLAETWDLVFIDAEKPGYIEYFNLVLPRLRKNGFILADNIFFHGQVLEVDVKNKSARGIQAFNEYLEKRTDVDKAVLTIRDGLFLIRKL